MNYWLMRSKKNQKGFTILELIIVVSILGILGAVLYPKFSGKEASSKIAATEMEVLRWYEAAKSYKANHGLTDFTGVTKANIVADGLMVDKTNSFGKAFTVAPKAGDVTLIEIVTDTDVATNATAVKDKIATKGYAVAVAGTTVTFESN